MLRVSLEGCTRNQLTQATAFVVGDGLALTVAHSFDGSEAPMVAQAGGVAFPAELVYLDAGRDIALLRYDADAFEVEPLELRDDADDPADAARLAVVRDSAIDVSPVELLRRTAVTLDGEGERRAIEIQGSIGQGDSGAPVLDQQGRAIAMVFARGRAGTDGDGTGWAVAASELVGISDQAGAPIPTAC